MRTALLAAALAAAPGWSGALSRTALDSALEDASQGLLITVAAPGAPVKQAGAPVKIPGPQAAAALEACLATLPERQAPPKPPSNEFYPLKLIAAEDMPPLAADDLALVRDAAERSRAYWKASRKPVQVKVDGESAPRVYSADRLKAGLELFRSMPEDPAAIRPWLAARFDLYESLPAAGGPGKVTKYCAPKIAISGNRTKKMPAAIYSVPSDLGPGPYLARKDIMERASPPPGSKALAWTTPTSLMTLQVEGSGYGEYPDGSKILLAYAMNNRRRWRSAISAAEQECRIPLESLPGSECPGVSNYQSKLACMESLDPALQQKIVNLDKSYVFFRAGGPNEQPEGSAGIELVPGRSIAIDPAFVPLGLPGLLVSPSFSRLVVTHDQGGEIKDGGRADYYVGGGPEAEVLCHSTGDPGRLFVFLPKN